MGVLKYARVSCKVFKKTTAHTDHTNLHTTLHEIHQIGGRVSVVIMQLHFLTKEKSKGGYVESGRREDGGQKSSVVLSHMEKQTKQQRVRGCVASESYPVQFQPV